MAVAKFDDTYKKCTCCKQAVHVYQFPFKKGSKTARVLTKCLSCVDQCTGRKCSLGNIAK